mmetsp:Transcript_3995/g.7980  ORF Transcript_3995/g.7980 Transcript_3995/m.7980 type:complete len:375 (-) Transcript_3995:172-1296(-)|eukprot:scaffold6420_cov168-Amphora_coffeaeformis.AAC.39
MPRIETDIKLDFKDVLFRPKRSTLNSRSQVNLERTFTFRNSGQIWKGTPLIAANMDTVGTFEMALELMKHGWITCVHKHYTVQDWEAFINKVTNDSGMDNPLDYVAISSGTSGADLDKIKEILDKFPNIKIVCLDVANGYSEHFVNVVKLVRQRHPSIIIFAGNVVTGEMVEELLLSGADVVKVGIGPGSVCTTRKQTGVGYPQLSAVLECADAAHGLNGHVISDGGCTCPGDVSKAFGAGADFVMLGGLLAGHDESGGKDIEVEDMVGSNRKKRKYKEFYGMSSTKAMEKHAGGVAGYRASEGKVVRVRYRGPVEATLKEIMGGVRSTCTYVGASKLKELSKRTTFIRVTQQINEVFGQAPNEQEAKRNSCLG